MPSLLKNYERGFSIFHPRIMVHPAIRSYLQSLPNAELMFQNTDRAHVCKFNDDIFFQNARVQPTPLLILKAARPKRGAASCAGFHSPSGDDEHKDRRASLSRHGERHGVHAIIERHFCKNVPAREAYLRSGGGRGVWLRHHVITKGKYS